MYWKPWCGGQGLRELIRMGEGDWVMREAASAPWFTGITITQFHAEKAGNINNFNYRWSTGYLQTEHISGISSVLGDMMLLQTGEVLRVMPCMPKNLNTAFYNLRAPGAFLLSGEMRDGEAAYIVIESLAGCELKLANPWSGQKVRLIDASNNVVLIESSEAVVSLPTRTGLILVCDRAEKPIDSFNKKTFED